MPVIGEDFTVFGVGAETNVTGIVAASAGFITPGVLPDVCDLWLDPANAFEVAFPTTIYVGYWTSPFAIPAIPVPEAFSLPPQGLFPAPTTA